MTGVLEVVPGIYTWTLVLGANIFLREDELNARRALEQAKAVYGGVFRLLTGQN